MSSNEWKICKLGDISTKITKGTTPTTLGFPFIESGINFIKAECLTFEGTIDSSKFVFISEEANEKLKRSIIEEGDILFSMAGMVLGKSAVVKKEHIPANTNQALAIIRLDKRNALPNFVDYFMRQKTFFNYVNSSTGQSAQPNINLEEIGNLIINLPSIETQTKITSILFSIDEKIENNLNTNQTLEEIARTLFKEWFVNFNYPNADGGRKHSEFGEIPSNWKVGILGDIYKTTSGGTPSRAKMEYYDDGIYQWVKSKELNNTFIIDTEEKITEEALKNSSAKILPKHSVLIAMYGATVGEIGITTEAVTCNQAICAFLPNENYPYTFIYHFLLQCKQDIINQAVGSAQQNISQQLLLQYKLVIPASETVKEFHKIVSPLFEKIQDNLAENETLKISRDSLLPKLMSGEIAITETT